MQNPGLVNPELLAFYQQRLAPNFANNDQSVKKQVMAALQCMVGPGSNRKQLCKLSRQCMLEEAPLLRSHLWKLLLGSLDLDPSTWAHTMRKNTELYRALRDKFCGSYVDEEDLLNLGSTSSFDQELWDEIELDTRRTHTTLNFFQASVPFGKVYASKPTKHCDMLTRILYIWGKTNSTVRYVQGMNQILAPLYYLQFQCLDSLQWDRESEVFFMFSALMSFVIDMHIKEMDECESGIMGRMLTLNKYLRIVDGELWLKMQKQGIYPQFYSFRWLALFLAQQFGLQQTIRIWDFVLSYDNYARFLFVYSLCIAILLARKTEIMGNDFITSLPLIQRLRDLDTDELIKTASLLFQKYKGINISEEFARLISQHTKEKQIAEQSTQSFKNKPWSYAELLKQTTSYMSKIATWAQNGANK